MDTEFKNKLQKAGNDRFALKLLFEEIDQTSRSIKAKLTRLSSEPSESDPVGRDRQNLIRRIKTKQDYLKTEREIVKNKLAEVKEYRRAYNHVSNNHRTSDSIALLYAFKASAIAVLDEEQVAAIEDMALNMKESVTDKG